MSLVNLALATGELVCQRVGHPDCDTPRQAVVSQRVHLSEYWAPSEATQTACVAVSVLHV